MSIPFRRHRTRANERSAHLHMWLMMDPRTTLDPEHVDELLLVRSFNKLNDRWTKNCTMLLYGLVSLMYSLVIMMLFLRRVSQLTIVQKHFISFNNGPNFHCSQIWGLSIHTACNVSSVVFLINMEHKRRRSVLFFNYLVFTRRSGPSQTILCNFHKCGIYSTIDFEPQGPGYYGYNG